MCVIILYIFQDIKGVDMRDKELSKILGSRVAELRKKRGLSREIICQSEQELTVRQLSRIEKGESLLTIQTAIFLAERLGVDNNYLLEPLSPKYLQLKKNIIRLNTYNDTRRKEQKEDILDEVFSVYYNNLPKDEQTAITILSTETEILNNQNTMYGDELFTEINGKIFKEKDLTINDLLYINFYCIYISGREELFSKEKFFYLIECISKVSNEDELFVELKLKLCVTFCGVMLWSNTLSEFPKLEKLFKKIMLVNYNTRYTPIYYMMQGKYLALENNDLKLAEKKFIRALEIADFLEDKVLYENIKREMKNDLG